MIDERDRTKWSWTTRAAAVFLGLAIYAVSTGPMHYVVAKVNGGNHTLAGPLRFVVMPYWPFYVALSQLPQPIIDAWESYDFFFWDLATKA